MLPFEDTQPRARSNNINPLSDVVRTTTRPLDYREFLSERDFAESPWNTNFGAERFFYLTGVTDAMRLLQEHSATFLKLKGHLDDILGDDDLARWAMQSGVPLNRPIKRERAGEIAVPRPTFFYKCVECLVAFESAFAASEHLKGKISPFWVYDYMRVVPAVYNIRKFNAEHLEMLRREYDGFNQLALNAIGQNEEAILDDLANGQTVTRPTAYRLHQFINAHCTAAAEHKVGEVRSRPGRRKLGIGPASINEVFELDPS